MKTNDIARIGLLIGEPARAAMLLALMDGRALSANELAKISGITPQTASRHLAQLVEARLLAVVKQGRHRYHQLASPDVAALIESMMHLVDQTQAPRMRIETGPKNKKMRQARLCYDHIAGRLGVGITTFLIEEGGVIFDSDKGQLTDRAILLTQKIGLEINTSTVVEKRPLCRPCLDWSERRFHIAGRFGQTLCEYLIQQDWLRKSAQPRVLEFTPKGEAGFKHWLGRDRWLEIADGQ
jgi:DNA-binding transcriptional ArsR family regulator